MYKVDDPRYNGRIRNKHGETNMWFKLIVTFALLYILIMAMSALKPSNEQSVEQYNHTGASCKEHGGYLYSSRYRLICGDGTEIRN